MTRILIFYADSLFLSFVQVIGKKGKLKMTTKKNSTTMRRKFVSVEVCYSSYLKDPCFWILSPNVIDVLISWTNDDGHYEIVFPPHA
jgi:hypothetical protein